MVDKAEYKKVSLTPIERQSMADTVIESSQKYGKAPIEMKFAIGFSLAVILIMMFGFYAIGKIALLASDKAIEGINIAGKIAEDNDQAINVIAENTKVQKIILGYLTNGKYNITFVAE